MKLLFCLSLLFALGVGFVGCSESPPEVTDEPQLDSKMTNDPVASQSDRVEVSGEPTIAESELEQTDEPSATPEDAAALEALMLSSTQLLSERQTNANEQVSVVELESLSHADREALSEKSAQQTAEAAEQKAERQAAAAMRQADEQR